MNFESSKYIAHLNKKVLTPFGYQRIEYIHRTPKLNTLTFTLQSSEGGRHIWKVEVAENHTFMIPASGEANEANEASEASEASEANEASENTSEQTDVFTEVTAHSLSKGDWLFGVEGPAKIINIEKSKEPKHLYDLSLDQSDFENQTYYTSGVLSHNSGKSITVATYLTWVFNFREQTNLGIVANRGAQAKEFLQNTKDIYTRIPIWLSQGIKEWNKTSIANELGSRILTDVPSVDAFRGFTVNVVVVDECAFIRESNWEEFADSVFPSQMALAWKKNIIISTAKGLNHFYEIVERARAAKILKDTTGQSQGTTIVEVKWDEVPRYNSKGELIDPEEFKKSVISKNGRAYFEQNFGNSFMGSAETLIDPDVLGTLEPSAPIDNFNVGYNTKGDPIPGLKIFEEPTEGKQYLMGVDAAKDGKDAFAVQILDVTSFPFKQVASANIQTDYLTMPEFLYDWGAYYNTALMIIENNEGAGQSIADTLTKFYEYPNLYYEERKNYPGFRTTSTSRTKILKLLKVLVDSNKLKVQCGGTIGELAKFELVNGKFQASSGHDDMVMALAISLAPLSSFDNFEDFGKFLESLKSKEEISTSDFFSFDSMMFVDD